jgi:hypothetical protein
MSHTVTSSYMVSHHQAVSQLLACHQVTEAIAVYRRAGLWRDAVTLARYVRVCVCVCVCVCVYNIHIYI